MKSVAIAKKNNEAGLRPPARPFFEKAAENSFFSAHQTNPSFFPVIQPKLTVGQAGDQYEQEADTVAEQVMRMPGTTAGPQAIAQNAREPQAKLIQQLPEEEEERLQAKGMYGGGVSGNFEKQLKSTAGGDRMDDPTSYFMESRFNADFSGVRIHNDRQAVQMSRQINAQAFAYGSDIYFNEGKYNPGTSEGKQLLAHELAHTIQQGASVQRKPVITPVHHQINVQTFDLPDIDLPDIDFPDIGIDEFRDKLGDYADDYLPAYSLLSVIIGYDLIRGEDVDRTRDNILKGVFSLINPFGSILYRRLEERGIIDDAFIWINAQVDELGLTWENVKQKFDEFWDEKDILRTDPISYNVGLLKRKFGPFITNIGLFIGRAADKVFTMIKDAFLRLLADLARQLGGYDLLADLLGQDPITGEERHATTADILRGILRLPVIQALGGDKLLIKLEKENLIERAAAWLDQQWALLQAAFASIYTIAVKFMAGFSLETLKDPMGFINGLKAEVVAFVTAIFRFFRNLASKVLELIKEALIALLKRFINSHTYGFGVVKVVLGTDPLTGEPYPRTPENIITAFLELLPNGVALAAHLKETGAIQQALDWVMGAVQEFIQVIIAIKDTFVNLWRSATIHTLFEPVPFFKEILRLFAKPVRRLVTFVRRVLFKLLEILFRIMRLPISLAQQILANIQRAYQDIRRAPVAFLLNLLGAVKQGFQQFFNNFLSHLLRGLQTWLFSQLAEAGIHPPTDLSFRSVLGLVFEIFGITLDNIINRMARKIGPQRVVRIRAMMDRLTGVWAFIKDVITRGPAAIWEHIQSRLSNLWDIIVENIKHWVVTRIIKRVTVKLLSMLDPTGIMAVVNGFIAFFNAIQSFIGQLRAMLEIVSSFVAGIVEIARGSLAQAATFLEAALARSLPVAIAFLANQVGLSRLGSRISEMIEAIREKINQAIDWLIDKAMQGGRAILNLITGGTEKGETSAGQEEAAQEPGDVKKLALRRITSRLEGSGTLAEAENAISAVLQELRPLGLAALRIVPGREENTFFIDAQASPLTHLLKLRPQIKKTRPAVTLAVRIMLAPGTNFQIPTQERELAPGISRPYVRAGQPGIASGTVETRNLGSRDKRKGSFRFASIGTSGRVSGGTGGAIIIPEQPVDMVEMLTWSNGALPTNVCHNDSHAEHQFINWFKLQPASFKQKVQHVELDLQSYSPCTFCVIDLIRMSNDPNINPEATFSISWSSVFTSNGRCKALDSSTDSLNTLKNAGWNISGPMPAEGRSPGELTVERIKT